METTQGKLGTTGQALNVSDVRQRTPVVLPHRRTNHLTSEGVNIEIIDSLKPDLDRNKDTVSMRRTRKARQFIPESRKDESYWSKRRRNNAAAKRSREKSRVKNHVLHQRIAELANENIRLQIEITSMKQHIRWPINQQFHIDTTIPSNKSADYFYSSDSDSSTASLVSGQFASRRARLGKPTTSGSELHPMHHGMSGSMPAMLPLVPAHVPSLIPSTIPGYVPHPSLGGRTESQIRNIVYEDLPIPHFPRAPFHRKEPYHVPGAEIQHFMPRHPYMTGMRWW